MWWSVLQPQVQVVKTSSRQPRNRPAWRSRNLFNCNVQSSATRGSRKIWKIAGSKKFTVISHMGASWCFHHDVDFRAFSFMIFMLLFLEIHMYVPTVCGWRIVQPLWSASRQLTLFFWSCNFGYRPNHSAKDVLTRTRIMGSFLVSLNRIVMFRLVKRSG